MLRTPKFQVQENVIQDQHPGEEILRWGYFPCLYTESLSPRKCGFIPSENFMEKHLANIHPDAVSDILTTGMLSMCFHKITHQEELLRWIFFIMAVHPESQVVEGCKRLIFDIVHTQCSQDISACSKTWTPSVLDILRVLVNFGAEPTVLLEGQTLYSEDSYREAFEPENDVSPAGNNNNCRAFGQNLREFLQTVSFVLQARPSYSMAELNMIMVIMARMALDRLFNSNVLLYEFSVVMSSLLPCYTEEEWNNNMPLLCYQLASLTSKHHNYVYMVQLFPHGKRGSCLQQRLSYLFLTKMLTPDVYVSRDEIIGYKISRLSHLFKALRLLAAEDLYALSSAVSLLDSAVGNEPLKSKDKDDLQYLMELLRVLTSDVRDNVRMLDHTRVKDLMVRISSKWTVTIQTTNFKQRSLFAWTKQKSPMKMKVEKIEARQSDHDSDEENPADVPLPMDTDDVTDSKLDIPQSPSNSRSLEQEILIQNVDNHCLGNGTGQGDVGNNPAETQDGSLVIENLSKTVPVISGDGPPKNVAEMNQSNIAMNTKMVVEDISSQGSSRPSSDDDESLPELDIL